MEHARDYTRTELRNIMQRCFNGEKTRYCRPCPAHPNNGGECCFGDIDEYDESDSTCKGCTHKSECRDEVFKKASTVTSIPTRPTRFSSSQSTNRLVQIGKPGNRPEAKPLLGQKPVSSVGTHRDPELKEMTPVQHFLYICFWGIFEGLFQTAAEYMRANRPDNRK